TFTLLAGTHGRSIYKADVTDLIFPDEVSEKSNKASGYELAQNYPNPFNPTTSIKVKFPQNENGTLKIYNILGQEVKTLHEGKFTKGTSVFVWNGTNNNGKTVSSGTYLYTLKTSNTTLTQKMQFLK
ncbi:T9SS type A sorting domain-containing protein, partial [bacterium]|nr:T9SS type A sorting domain-containing protein [bacterium]